MIKTLSIPSLSQLPAAVRSFIRPMLFAALGLHAIVLFMPFPKASEKPPEDKEAPVKITQLPTTKANATKTPKIAISKPSRPALPKINRPNTNPIIQKSANELPQPQATAEAPQTETRASTKADTATAADFPHYNPSTPNCFGLGLGENCRVATANLSTVAAFYLSAPKAKGFTLTPDEESADKKTYTVTTPDKKTLFLHLFKDEPTTVVLLSDSKVADLATLKGSVNIPEDYYNLITELAPQVDRSDNPETNARPEHFANPQLFFKVLNEADLQSGAIPETRSGIDGSPTLILGQAPEVFYNTISTAGLAGTFQVTPKGQYGGGKLYELQKDNITFYMNLVPTKDQSGTIVITWLKNPAS
ncbi:hypothetical protein [Leptolyngbya sp. FACHB-17]|uniref:hypothetical protein n=1 Tax=unclassified Leptolyngbya TaxID=2650499 RepID=UPI001680BC1A|nr:hypothetical protein [Leptolyngbya sp. FACHB-17]MBD2079945.1 hypothetical protein [Leptolyngbya sp. FACHB-17]